jgi:hypothetical protein
MERVLPGDLWLSLLSHQEQAQAPFTTCDIPPARRAADLLLADLVLIWPAWHHAAPGDLCP